jgi:hypothetical protein
MVKVRHYWLVNFYRPKRMAASLPPVVQTSAAGHQAGRQYPASHARSVVD